MKSQSLSLGGKYSGAVGSCGGLQSISLIQTQKLFGPKRTVRLAFRLRGLLIGFVS